MTADRLQRNAIEYRPKGRRIMGRPTKRWKYQLDTSEPEQGLIPGGGEEEYI